MKQNDLLMDISILYRRTQKFYDAQLKQFHLSYAQLPVLIMIYETEGISLQEIVVQGDYDKGTISKTVKNLENLNYIRVDSSLKDKRVKELYTTDKAKQIMSEIYAIRRRWWKHLISNIDEEQLTTFLDITHSISEKSIKISSNKEHRMSFMDWKKLSLSAYEGKISSVLYTGGCNFRCPMCEKKKFVFLKDENVEINQDRIYEFLRNRKSCVEAICIDGGEPFMHASFLDILREMKKNGYKIKVLTNGSYFESIQKAIDEGLVDMISMRIQNSIKEYGRSIGMKEYDLTNIRKCVSYLLEGHVEYEFRITLVAEYHTLQSVEQMANWIRGAESVLLSNYDNDTDAIDQNLHGVSNDLFHKMNSIIASRVKKVKIC